MFEHRSAKRFSPFAKPYFSQCYPFCEDITERMRLALVVAARQHIAMHVNHTPAPQAIAAVVQAVLGHVAGLTVVPLVARVLLVGGHQRRAIFVIIELGCFHRQQVCPQPLVLFAEHTPFCFVGLQTEALQLDDHPRVCCLFRVPEQLHSFFRLVHTATAPILLVGLLRPTVEADDDTAESSSRLVLGS